MLGLVGRGGAAEAEGVEEVAARPPARPQEVRHGLRGQDHAGEHVRVAVGHPHRALQLPSQALGVEDAVVEVVHEAASFAVVVLVGEPQEMAFLFNVVVGEGPPLDPGGVGWAQEAALDEDGEDRSSSEGLLRRHVSGKVSTVL